MSSFIVQLSHGEAKQPSLGFFAKSVEIDNQGGQYVHIPAIGLFVPPYFEGVAANFPVATQNPIIDTTPPSGLFANPSGNPATLRFSDKIIGISGGSLNTALLQANANVKNYTVAAGGSVSDTLTFIAASVVVNNPGGQWINITSENATIPPFTVGVVIPLHNATTAVGITTTPPAGQVNTGAGQAAVVSYTDLPLAANAGTPAASALSEASTLTAVLIVNSNPNASSITIGNIGYNFTGRVAYLRLVMFWNTTTPLGGVVSVRFKVAGNDVYADILEIGRGNDNATARTPAIGAGIVFPVDARPPFSGTGNITAVVTFEDGQQFNANSIVAYLSAGLVTVTL